MMIISSTWKVSPNAPATQSPLRLSQKVKHSRKCSMLDRFHANESPNAEYAVSKLIF